MRFDAEDALWRVTPRSSLPALQKHWLTLGGSLTARLAELGRVEVRVTREALALPWRDERDALHMRSRERAWVRDVVLVVDGVPFVAAHSATPLSASLGAWRSMRRLRTRPLAELLYSDPGVARSTLVSRSVTARHPLFVLAAAQDIGATRHAYAARRSVFVRHEAPLIVTECLLPALWQSVVRAKWRNPSIIKRL